MIWMTYVDDSNNDTVGRGTGSEDDICSQICNATKQGEPAAFKGDDGQANDFL